ncbi:hypothetical protein ACFL0H_13425 [Thermodesulfobacteriota bacterium]
MPRCALYLAILVSFVSLTACGKTLFQHIKKGPPGPPPGANINAPMHTATQSEFTVKNLISYAYLLFKEYKKPIIACLALIFLWVFTRGYYKERNNKKIINLTTEDLGIIKNIKINAAMIWEKYRPGKNVVWLKDWKKETEDQG